MTEREAMQRALELALRGWGRVSPNPMVGAVLLRDGEVVGEGYHREFGAAHAEVEALRSSADPKGATCVVNLEPCSHFGKTPPCSTALVEAGIRRVVIALAEQNPVAARGAARMAEAGIEVSFGLLDQEAAALNAPFLWSHRRPRRAFVAAKLALSADGFIAGLSGKPRRISGPEADEYVQWLRAGFAALAVGRRTAEVDDPRLTVRGPVQPREPPTRVVVSSGRTPVRDDLYLWRTAREIPSLLVRAHQSPSLELMPPTPFPAVDVLGLNHALEVLKHRGLSSVLVEGGGELLASLLREELLDRIYLIRSPRPLGEGIPAFPGLPPRSVPEPGRWTVTERKVLGRDNLLVLDRKLCLPES